MQKKATHSDVSRSCGIIHGYARIRNPRLPRFLFGGGMVTLFLALLDHLPEPLHDSRILVGEERRTAFVQRSYLSHLLVRQNLGSSPRQFRAANRIIK